MKRLIFVLIVLLSSSALPSIASEEDSVTSDSVSFGASFPATGVASPGVASYYSGINAYFSYVNDNGGVYGRKINFIRKDDGNLPGRAIAGNNELILANNVLALISTAPSCATQVAVNSNANLGAKGIPNLFVDCLIEKSSEDSEQTSPSRTSTSYYGKISSQNQITLLKSHIDKAYPNQKIVLVYQDDDNSIGISKIKTDSKVLCSKSFIAGLPAAQTLGSVVSLCKINGDLKDGDLVFYAGSPTGLGSLISQFLNAKLNLKYFVNSDAFNPTALAAMGIRSNLMPEIYTLSSNALISETSNDAIKTFLAFGQKYQGNSTLDQQFINGMNVGYIVSNLLGAVGPDLTRERLMKAMDLYGAQFDALGLSERSQDPATRFMPLGGVIVKNSGTSSEAVSDVLTLENGNVSTKPRKQIPISPKSLPILVQKLPNSAPAPKASTPSAAPTTAPAPKKTVSPAPAPSSISELDGEEELPFGKISVKKEKNKYLISISSNLPNENLQVRASKKGQRSISFKVTTDDDGLAKFNTSRSLAGFQVALLLDGEILNSVRAS